MAQEFGRAQLIIEADDKRLQATLKRDEAVVTASVAKMQGSINQLTVSTGGLEAAAGQGTEALGAFGAASALVGGEVGGTAGQVAVFAASIKSLIPTAEAGALANRSLLKTVVALGASLAPIVIPIAAVIVAWKVYTSVIGSAKEMTDEAADALAVIQKRLRDTQKAERTLVRALEKRIKILGGAQESEFLREGSRARALQEEIERIARVEKRETARATNLERIRTAEKARLVELKRLEDERLAVAEQLVQAARDEAEAHRRAGLTGGRAPETRFEAEVQLVRGLVQAATTTQGQLLKLEAAQRLVSRGGFGQIDLLRQVLGLGGGGGPRDSTRSIGVSAFAVSGLAAPTGAVRPVAAAAKQERRDDKRNQLLEDMGDKIGMLVRLLGEGGLTT